MSLNVSPLSVIIGLAGFVIVIAGMRSAESILVPLLLAGFIATVAIPPMFWLQRHKVPTVLAILMVITVVLMAMLIIGALIGSSLNEFSRDLPNYQAQLRAKINVATVWLNEHGVAVSNQDILQYIDPGRAMQWVSVVLRSVGGVLSNAFMILLTIIFILAEASSFPAKLRALLGNDSGVSEFDKFLNKMKTYVGIKTLASLCTGILVGVWLTILGVDYPVLWGLVAFLLNYVPTIGSIIAAVPAVLLALIQSGIPLALMVALGYVATNISIGNFIEPRFMGKGLGLSTLVVFLSLIFWGWVLGPVGMLLSVPLTMTLKIAFDSHQDTRWLAILLGPERGVERDNN